MEPTITHRLALCNYTSAVRKIENKVPLCHWYCVPLTEPLNPTHIFHRAKVLFLASRRLALLYSEGFDGVDQVRTLATKKDIRQLQAIDKARTVAGQEYLVWLPHHKLLATYSTLSRSAKNAMQPYSYSKGVIVTDSGLDFGPCFYLGATGIHTGSRGRNYIAPLFRQLDLTYNKDALPDVRDVLAKFRGGYLFQQEFESKVSARSLEKVS